MKNLLMIAIALMTISANAQERKKIEKKEGIENRAEMRQNLTPEESAKLQTKKMTLRLDLNEKQQIEVEKLFLAQAKERSSKIEAFKSKKETAAGEKLSKEERLKMKNDRLDYQIEMKKKMKVILNADQYAKLENMQEERQSTKEKKYHVRKQKD